MAFIAPPERLKPFPDAERVKPKDRARRWEDRRYIYTWDGTHGRIEKFDKTGRHLGEYHPETGELTKDAVPGRRIEV